MRRGAYIARRHSIVDHPDGAARLLGAGNDRGPRLAEHHNGALGGCEESGGREAMHRNTPGVGGHVPPHPTAVDTHQWDKSRGLRSRRAGASALGLTLSKGIGCTKKGKKCTLTITKRTLSFVGKAKANTFELKLRGLAKGRYTTAVTAHNANGKSATVKRKFTIIRG